MRKNVLRVVIHLIVCACVFCGTTFYAQSSSGAADQASAQTPKTVDTRQHTHVHLGSVSVGAFYSRSRFASPFYPCSPFMFDPFYCGWGPYYAGLPYFYPMSYYNGFVGYGEGGEVRLQTNLKGGEVYLNDAYAGDIKDRKSFWLAPGVYELEVRQGGQQAFHKKIYVLTGKTVKVNAFADRRGEVEP